MRETVHYETVELMFVQHADCICGGDRIEMETTIEGTGVSYLRGKEVIVTQSGPCEYAVRLAAARAWVELELSKRRALIKDMESRGERFAFRTSMLKRRIGDDGMDGLPRPDEIYSRII